MLRPREKDRCSDGKERKTDEVTKRDKQIRLRKKKDIYSDRGRKTDAATDGER